jgi:hypothetical protein
MKVQTAKKYQDSTKYGRASTETRKLNEYDSDTENETIKHSNRNKDNKGDNKKKIRGKSYMDTNEAHYRMGHQGETALRSILNHHVKARGTLKNCISCMK